MQRLLKVTLGVLILTLLITLYVFFLPAWWGSLGAVSVSFRGYNTNASGQAEALVAITNEDRHTLQLSTGTEVRADSRWTDSSGVANHLALTMESSPTLAPGAGRVIAVPVPTTSPWRVFAYCHRTYAGKFGFILDGYILKRHVFQKFYSTEIAQ